MSRFIELTQGYEALVDDDDYEMLMDYKWYLLRGTKTNYAEHNLLGKMHNHLISPPPGMRVDHEDTNGLNNTRSNLRLATISENNRNRSKFSKSKFGACSSQYKGVTWNKEKRLWKSTIRYDGKQHHLGYYKNEIDAAIAYDLAARKHHGEFALVNTYPPT